MSVIVCLVFISPQLECKHVTDLTAVFFLVYLSLFAIIDDECHVVTTSWLYASMHHCEINAKSVVKALCQAGGAVQLV